MKYETDATNNMVAKNPYLQNLIVLLGFSVNDPTGFESQTVVSTNSARY